MPQPFDREHHLSVLGSLGYDYARGMSRILADFSSRARHPLLWCGRVVRG